MKTFRSFLSAENGGLIVEFVLWLPFIIVLLILAIDGAFLMSQNSKMKVATRDILRLLATGQGGTYAQGQTSGCSTALLDAVKQVFPGEAANSFECNIWRGAEANSEADLVKVALSIPMTKILAFGTIYAPTQKLVSRGIGLIQEPGTI